jgi:LuxR family maltose regulon positive regulatory protein
MEPEFLSRISPKQRAFLTRTAVLERMCGPLCEAVLEAAGSAAVLADLAGANLPLVPLDRRGEWYRYHHLFRDMLLAELQRREPVLRHCVAGWYLRNGWPEDALECSMAAEDVDGAARLAGQLAVSVTGRAGSPPSSDGSAGWRTGTGSKDTRWSRCWPRCFPC